jgi:hypothetical protein
MARLARLRTANSVFKLAVNGFTLAVNGGFTLAVNAAFTLALALAAGGAAAAQQAAQPAVQQVTLPLPQYEALRARANPAPAAPPPPPAPFALEGDEVEVRAGATAARVVQVLTLTLYSPDWQTIALGEAGSFLSAELGDLEGRVAASGNGLGDLYVRGQGRHRVRLESVVAVARDETATRPAWGFSLRLPPAAVVHGSIAGAPETAAAIEEIELAGGTLQPEEDGPAAGRVRGADGAGDAGTAARGGGAGRADGRSGGRGWTFAAPPGGVVQVTLLGKATLPARALLPLRYTVSAATAAVLSRTQARVHGWIEARVAQGRLGELEVALPPGFEVMSASGPLAAWRVAGGKLVLTPLAPVEDALAVEVELKGLLPETFAMPLLLPEGGARTTLLAKVGLSGDGVPRLVEAGSSRPAEEGDEAGLSAKVREVAGQLYRVLDARRPPRWQVEWADRTAVLAAEVDGLWVEVVAGDAGRASYQLWAAVRNHGAPQLTITLPAGFELEEASREGQLVVPGTPAGETAAAGETGDGRPASGKPGMVPLAPGSSGKSPLAPGSSGKSPLAPGVASGLAAGASFVVPLLTRDAAQVIYLAGLLPLALPREGGDLLVPLPALSAPAARVEAQVLLPAGRSYALADPSRAGSGGPPPRAGADAAPANAMGRELRSRRGRAAAVAARPVPRPAGFAELLASWSALSANPAPLAIHVKSAKEDNPWF